ncbi:tetratricopeptide repeat protein [Aliikangiella coralliicola]|uniref:Sel1 repeat family protein n=1 Tax=Aliikangiella coralliicola TaxID=2592383 RepID=A0A545UBT0_9GAMM|nr:tetratricopeptide repeat protein [Aliikangiella coralliicola]TQV86883.1 sel1 repeat family protein [Aliikangiella coralliicola]
MVSVRFWLFVVLVILLAGCEDERKVEQALLTDCVSHYRAESYRVASKTCLTAAEQGIPRAQWLLAHIYYYDLAEQNRTAEQAFEWFLKAAESGWPEAQTFVGESYVAADGVEQDFDKAYQWLVKAAKFHDTKAEFALGMMFYNGQGRPKDLGSAISWFKKAATKRHTMSINNLAWLHATTTHKAYRNAKKAMFWADKLEQTNETQSIFLDTRAAAYALAGEFNQAITLQSEAISLLPEDVDEDRLLDFQQRLEAYEQHRAWEEKE